MKNASVNGSKKVFLSYFGDGPKKSGKIGKKSSFENVWKSYMPKDPNYFFSEAYRDLKPTFLVRSQSNWFDLYSKMSLKASGKKFYVPGLEIFSIWACTEKCSDMGPYSAHTGRYTIKTNYAILTS